MAPQLYLITPVAADPDRFAQTLLSVLQAAPFSALLVRQGNLDDAAYAQFAATLVSTAQGAGCAVLIQDDVALARRLGADGVHVTGGPSAVKAAVGALKPGLIVGAGNSTTRHDAMTMGEMDVDYLFFGPLDGAIDSNAADLAEWWAATFEIPAVLSDPAATPDIDARGAEFLALSASIWNADNPAAAAAAIANAMAVA
tara:strand:+ start:74 stop:670 length:597 start_codon:yes stop_codon:yes gene_type:complete